MKYRKSQLNAISRSYTAKNRKQAVSDLQGMGIDFEEYCKMFGYKGSPCKLLTSINTRSAKTLGNVEKYRAESDS